NWNNGGGWNDATADVYPDWLQIDFNGSKSIDEIDVLTIQDDPASPAEPTLNMTFVNYGITAFEVQYWIGSGWATVPGGRDRKRLNWNNGGGWNDATADVYPDWLQIDFNGSKSIDEIDVFTIQDDPASPAEPTLNMTFVNYGITAFEVQYWIGSGWATVPGG